MTEPEYVEKPGPLRRAYNGVKAAVIWLRTRRSSSRIASAIASNQAATAALALSVAAAGIGGVATYQANEAGNKADRATDRLADLESRVATVETGLNLQAVGLARLKQDVANAATVSDIRMRAMGLAADKLSTDVARLADNVAGMPREDARVAPLAAKVSRLAADTRDTARQAQEAAQKAAQAQAQAESNATDPAAREQAEAAKAAANQAAVDAQRAADRAAEAQRVADAAQAEAEAGYQPIPRTVELGSDTRTVNAGPFQKSFVVDLPQAALMATFTGQVTAPPAQHWVAQLRRGNAVVGQVTGTGNGQVTIHDNFSSPGGTLSFLVYFDADVAGAGNITISDMYVTFNYQAATEGDV